MPKYFVVDFAGHNRSENCGKRNHTAFANLKPLVDLGDSVGNDVSRFAYWSGFGITGTNGSDRVAHSVMADILGYNGGDINGVTFIIHGYSAGGITALQFALYVPNAQIVYIALSDAAFYAGESDFFMIDPGSTAYYLNENYYQLNDRSPKNPEIHGMVIAQNWQNYDLTIPNPGWFENTHDTAVRMSDGMAFAKMQDIIRNGR